ERHREEVSSLLLRASELVRAQVPGPKRDYRGADLIGADLNNARLAGASFRGARLIGAGLRGADLSLADLTGTDLRGADVRGADPGAADLARSLFLTQSQLDAAMGDPGTRLPPSLARPAHWSPPANGPAPAP